jgi:hypothetical protein
MGNRKPPRKRRILLHCWFSGGSIAGDWKATVRFDALGSRCSVKHTASNDDEPYILKKVFKIHGNTPLWRQCAEHLSKIDVVWALPCEAIPDIQVSGVRGFAADMLVHSWVRWGWDKDVNNAPDFLRIPDPILVSLFKGYGSLLPSDRVDSSASSDSFESDDEDTDGSDFVGSDFVQDYERLALMLEDKGWRMRPSTAIKRYVPQATSPTTLRPVINRLKVRAKFL